MGSTFLDDFIGKEFSYLKTQCTSPRFGGLNKTFLGEFFPLSLAEPVSVLEVASVLLMHKVLLGACGLCDMLRSSKIDLEEVTMRSCGVTMR